MFQESVSKAKKINARENKSTQDIAENGYLVVLQARKFQSESDKDVERREIWSDDDRSVISKEIRVDQYSLDDHDTDQADMGRSEGRVVDTYRRNCLCHGGDRMSRN
eukprot:9495500-Karenia_brevis.AAC.1